MPTVKSFCRICTNRCAITVQVEHGRVTRVSGDAADPLYGGYTCVKGRSQPDYLNSPQRLLHSLKRTVDNMVAIPIEQAQDEIAQQLLRIRGEYGPRAIAGFAGHMRASVLGPDATYSALLDLIGTNMRFDPNTIDKGGKQIAQAMLGRWQAPAQAFDDPQVALLIGVNPMLTYTGFPAGNPHRWLREAQGRGMRLVVVDPRRTEVAARADLHLCPRPGYDAHLLAAMALVIIEEGLLDRGFVADNVSGVAALHEAVRRFRPGEVARSAEVDTDDLVRAARIFGSAARGYAFAGTGPSMAATGSLCEYLVLVLETICGHWLRAGEVVRAAPTLLAAPTYRAQAEAPRPWRTGERVRVRQLQGTTAGMPTAALTDEMLLPGAGRVRALLSWCGNPALSFPDQRKTLRALGKLELLVQIDPWFSATARIADYVIAPTMPLEVASATVALDSSTRRATGYGTGISYANYTPAVVESPAGSDLIEEWRFFQGLYERMQPELDPGGPVPAAVLAGTTEQLLDLFARGSRVPLDRVRLERGRLYPEPAVVVAAKEPGWTGRLDVANPEALDDLAGLTIDPRPTAGTAADEQFPFRLLCRRLNYTYNSSCNVPATNRGRPYNPAFLHPDDLAALGLAEGDRARCSSALDTIDCVVHADPTARPGTVAMAFGYGGAPDRDEELYEIGSSPNRLIADDRVYDRYIGQPLMSNVPVRIVAYTV